ncbi:2-keto-4-pentenoate hydratase [Roseomonas marmotae]|uniref:Fumarylacetoacetate hydrolase family protein n=1 Tax=Roseomonas marmotae TaxID=2768161 RepID=A0ABS3K9H1_9PROT|nr:fumarylacetoacetate hydrolase family protein [Roseomonas marmotae]MBO1074104.1 fumarylacetoacetate hydrolase family protein [Roseomonas marmotae]QTI78886.1 fumarylacetoacetate hydrolase family protein [Roseomonas marmotae]
MVQNSPERAAQLLVAVRQGQERLKDLPEDLRPRSTEQAYAIQDGVIRLLGPIGGWKVSPKSGHAEPGCSPISAALIQASPASLAQSAVPGAEIEVEIEIEIEIAVTLGHDLPPRATPYTPEDLRAAIAALHPAVELLSSRFRDRRAAAPLSLLADSQSNAAVVLGAGLAEWEGLDLREVAMHLRLDREQVAAVNGGAGIEDVLAALAWLANHAAARTGGLRKGEVVITGARIGPWSRGDATEVEADVAGLGTVAITFT